MMKYMAIICIIAIFMGGCGFQNSYEKEEPHRSSQPNQGSKEFNSKDGAGKSKSSGITHDVKAKERELSEGERQAYYSEVSDAIQEMQGAHYENAVATSDAVLRNNPEQTAALSTKGMALALLGRVDEGIEILQKAYTLDTGDINIYYNLAIAYKLKGDLGSSKTWFEKVLDRDPRHVWATYGIATIYADTHKDEQALALLEQAIALDETGSVKEAAREQDHFQSVHGNTRFQQLVK